MGEVVGVLVGVCLGGTFVCAGWGGRRSHRMLSMPWWLALTEPAFEPWGRCMRWRAVVCALVFARCKVVARLQCCL